MEYLGFILLFIGFIIGLSIGAILSWRDDNYSGKSGLIWIFNLALSLSAGILALILYHFKLIL